MQQQCEEVLQEEGQSTGTIKTMKKRSYANFTEGEKDAAAAKAKREIEASYLVMPREGTYGCGAACLSLSF